MSPTEPSRRLAAVLLLAIVLLGGGLRLWNLDWDRNVHLHPDERYLAIVSSKVSAPDGPGGWFDTDASPLNPANQGERFVYGTAPLFLTKGTATWLHHGAETGDQPARAVTVGLDRVGVDLLDDDGRPRFDGGYDDVLVGRLISALLDTATILVVFAIGRRVAGRRAALAGALVWASCALAIQHAHFFVVEPMLVLATALALLAAVEVVHGRGRWVLAMGGAAAGLAGASKVSGLAVLGPLAAASLLRHRPALAVTWGALRNGVSSADGASRSVRRRAGAIGRAVRSVDRGGVVAVATDGAVLVLSAFVVFRVLQPYAFDGPASLDGRWSSTLRDLQALQDGADTPPNVQWTARVPVLEPLGHLVRFGFGIPATLLALAALARLRRRQAWAADPAFVVLVGWIAVMGALFLPRFVSSMRYLLPAYPALAVVAGIGAARLLDGRRVWRRVGVVGMVLVVLWGVAFAHGVYGQEHPRLAASDWLVANAPDGAVLSFQEWDDGLPVGSEAAADKGFESEKLTPFAVETPENVRALAASLDRIDLVVESSDRVTATVTRIPGRYDPILRYYRALEDGSLGFELAASFTNEPTLFGVSIPDGGSEEAFRVYDHPPVRIWRKTSDFSLERTLAILQSDRATASEHVPLDAGGANGLLQRADGDGPGTGPTFDGAFPDRLPVPWLFWFAWWEVTALAALPWVTRLFGAVPDRGLGVAKVLGPLAVVVPLWLTVALGLVTFSATSAWVATALVVAAGVAVPRWRRDARALVRERRGTVLAIEGLALGAFAAVLLLRANVPDLWFHPTGGEKPFGTAYFSAVARSGSFPPADPWFSGGVMNYYYGGWFSLAVPARALGVPPEIVLNLAIATSASLACSVAWSIGAGLAGLRRAVAGRASVVAGVVAAGLLLAVGNLAAARQQEQRLVDAARGKVAPTFDWWGTSRLNPGTNDINEFPAWTVLFGDPHPHLLALPVLLALVAVLGAYVATRRHGSAGAARGLAVVAGVGVAWTRIGHTWDLPTVILLSVAAVVAGSAIDPVGDRGRWWRGGRHLLVLGAVALAVSHPYARAIQVFDSGFTRAPAHTPFGSFLLQVGLPVGVSLVYVASRWSRAARQGTLPRLLAPGWSQVGLAASVAGGAMLVTVAAGPVAALAILVVVAGLVLAAIDLRAGDVGQGVAAGLVAAGAGLAALPEVFVIVNDLGRMNTVFKFGYTAWALLAVGTAVLAVDLVGRAGRGRVWVAAGLLLAAMPGLLFWPSATPRRLEARFARLPLTLDGRDWLRHGPVVVETQGVPPIDVTADEPMIAWLRANVRGGDTIVEQVGPSYTWVSRVSVATGLPTVVGWQFHQVQQRRGYGPSVDERVAAVTALYGDPAPEQALRTLAAYRPDYVVVGTVERALGSPDAIAGLARLPGLEPAWTEGSARVYRVDHLAIDEHLAEVDAERIREAEASAPAPAPAEG